MDTLAAVVLLALYPVFGPISSGCVLSKTKLCLQHRMLSSISRTDEWYINLLLLEFDLGKRNSEARDRKLFYL